MPLQKLQFRPGINRESTTLANEGGWFESEKVRFRSGSPEKIGGWVADTGTAEAVLAPPTGSYWGVARALWNWVTLYSYNLLAVGTNLKYYIQNGVGGFFYDVTPIRVVTPAGEATFAATAASTILTVTDAGHGAKKNDFVTFSDAVSLGGVITATVLNSEFQIQSITSNNVYTITSPVAANGSDVGDGGASTVAAYQITTGSDIYTVSVGWGSGGWGGINTGYTDTGWGSPAPAGTGLGRQLRLWSQSNYGEDLIFNPRGGALYYWAANANPNVFDRGAQITDPDAPTVCNYVMVSDASRFVIAFGANDYGESAQNPLLIRWSDQEDYTSWTPAITNQAGSYQLSHGSSIITALQSRQEILVWTDAVLYSMQYLGPPYVWGFQLLADNISIAGPNTVTTASNITYWMGTDKFYMYSGRVETLPCTLRTYVYNDINMSQSYQFFAGTNEGFNEIWWYYCSENSTTIDKYVVYNHLERVWYYGTLNRSAWLDSPLRTEPMATTYAAQLLYHETGVDDGTTNPPSPITAYVQSSDFDIGDGHNFGFVWRIIPDVTFDGSTVNAPALDFTVRPRQFPGSNYGPTDNPTVISSISYAGQRTYNVQQFTEQVYVRIRGRQMAFKAGSTTLGTAWQLGVPRIEVRPDGRK
tara:strand:- start:1360 stop:3291 length:1932 start_codon:yes stop_codon:yes gene_type:complete